MLLATITGSGSNVLTLDNTSDAIASILSRGTTADSFDIEFGDFEFDGDLTFENDGATTTANFGTLTQDASSSINNGGIFTTSAVDNITLNQANDFTVVDVQTATTAIFNDTNQFDATSMQTLGDATVTANGAITLNNTQVGGLLTATTPTGDINVAATGDLSLDDISTSAGTVEIVTDGNILIGSVNASGNVDITTSSGSINDLQDDLAIDITSGDTIQLNATTGIGSGAVGAMVDAAGKLEVADGSDSRN